jgi:hypothetical protein
MEEMKKCKVCEMWCEDTTNGICESCIDGILDTVTLDDAIEYASTLDNTYEDNELIFYTQNLFNRDEVIEILKREALKAYDLDNRIFDNEIKEFINTDTGHYLDYLENRGEL